MSISGFPVSGVVASWKQRKMLQSQDLLSRGVRQTLRHWPLTKTYHSESIIWSFHLQVWVIIPTKFSFNKLLGVNILRRNVALQRFLDFIGLQNLYSRVRFPPPPHLSQTEGVVFCVERQTIRFRTKVRTRPSTSSDVHRRSKIPLRVFRSAVVFAPLFAL